MRTAAAISNTAASTNENAPQPVIVALADSSLAAVAAISAHHPKRVRD